MHHSIYCSAGHYTRSTANNTQLGSSQLPTNNLSVWKQIYIINQKWHHSRSIPSAAGASSPFFALINSSAGHPNHVIWIRSLSAKLTLIQGPIRPFLPQSQAVVTQSELATRSTILSIIHELQDRKSTYPSFRSKGSHHRKNKCKCKKHRVLKCTVKIFVRFL
jgi:hypothetical protein